MLADSGARVAVRRRRARGRSRAGRAGRRACSRAGDELERALAAASDEPLPLDGPRRRHDDLHERHHRPPEGREAPPRRDARRGARRPGALRPLDRPRRLGPAPRHRPALPRGAAHVRGLRPAERRARRRDAALGRARAAAPRRRARRRTTPTSCRPCSCACCGCRTRSAPRFDARPAPHVVLHGAAPIAPAVKQRMIEWWGPVLVEYWGGTEGGVTTLVDSHEWLAHPGTVGRALPHCEVFAVDDAGRRLPPGGEGRLYQPPPRPRRELFVYHARRGEDRARLPRRSPRLHARRRRLASTRTATCTSPTASRT